MPRRIAFYLAVLLLATACQDLPSEPRASSDSARAGQRDYILPPVVVIGECDPWMSLDWCSGDGGDCMTSVGGDVETTAVQGCGPGGGGGAGGGGGGGGSGPGDGSTPPDEGCPSQDPECLKPLSSEQIAAVDAAKALFKTQFADPAAQAACQEMRNALAAVTVYQGNPLIEDADGHSHSGQYWQGSIHIDADWFDHVIALGDYRTLGYLLLHEAAHSLGYKHAGETGAPYSTYPFNHVSDGSGVETCIA
ncbi:MAG TPA: hypothetical protein VFR37_01720 [Longimicrobium sp.]|nr:hypothetical protein [Longimicrobium sp.]